MRSLPWNDFNETGAPSLEVVRQRLARSASIVQFWQSGKEWAAVTRHLVIPAVVDGNAQAHSGGDELATAVKVGLRALHALQPEAWYVRHFRKRYGASVDTRVDTASWVLMHRRVKNANARKPVLDGGYNGRTD